MTDCKRIIIKRESEDINCHCTIRADLSFQFESYVVKAEREHAFGFREEGAGLSQWSGLHARPISASLRA